MGITITEEWYEVKGECTMYPVKKRDITFVNGQYLERNYKLSQGISVLIAVKEINEKEYLNRIANHKMRLS